MMRAEVKILETTYCIFTDLILQPTSISHMNYFVSVRIKIVNVALI